MMKHFILPIAGIFLIGAASFQTTQKVEIAKYKLSQHKHANGAPSGKTGAPGELTCTECHSGTAQSGSGINVFTVLNSSFAQVTTYVPGQTYNVALLFNNSNTKGFEAIALSSTNTMAGSFSAGANTQIVGTGNQYATHTSTSNTGATTIWSWSWTAPATDVGDITFYVATNKANGSADPSGDVIYLSQHIIGSTAGIKETENASANFSAGYSVETNALTLGFNSLTAENTFLNLVDLNGKSVFTYDMGNAQIGANKQQVVLPSGLKAGYYIVNFFVGNKAMSAKIVKQ